MRGEGYWHAMARRSWWNGEATALCGLKAPRGSDDTGGLLTSTTCPACKRIKREPEAREEVMTVRLVAAPGTAAPSAKNAPAVPGLPNLSADLSERNPMLRTTIERVTAAARAVWLHATGDALTYTPRQLNALLDAQIGGGA